MDGVMNLAIARRARWAALLVVTVSAVGMFAWGAAPAGAAYYTWQPFCPHGAKAFTPDTIYAGQRCVAPLKPRIEFLAYQKGIAWYPGVLCLVGKANPDGSGGNTFPVTCGAGDANGLITTPAVPGGAANNGWPTVINQESWSTGGFGIWNGFFP